MQVLTCSQWQAQCRDRQGEIICVDIQLLDQVQPGCWLLVQAGSAWRVLSEQQAAESLAVLATMENVLRGDAYDLQHGFADLIGRTPQLPAHLRGQATLPGEDKTNES